jgi:Glutaredoxin and related proteins
MMNNIKLYSTEWCGDCVRSKKLLEKLGITYEEIDIDFDKEAYKKVSELQNRKPRIPTIVFDDGSYLVEPTDVELLEKINSYQS